MFQRTCSLSRAFLLFVVSAGCTYMCSSVINSAFNAIVTVANVRYWDHFLFLSFYCGKLFCLEQDLSLLATDCLPCTLYFHMCMFMLSSLVSVRTLELVLREEEASLNCKRDLAMEYLLVLYLNYPLFENANLHEFILFIC